MRYYNINDLSERVSLREAVLKSSSRVSGLYLPERIPLMDKEFIRNLRGCSLQEIALEASSVMLGEDIPYNDLDKIVKTALNFEIPLKRLDKDLFVLELFHGPTMAFKDVGARFMAGIFEHFLRGESHKTTILVATSGDTGSAVANAFFEREGIRVVILYPSGRISDIQEKQLTTMGGNITALEVEGNFDDCQRLVKEAFADKKLNEHITLTSANSINFARLFPQAFYYFYAASQLPREIGDFVISVPSGNFGNLTAGLIARKMGLPVHMFIAGNNSNHSVADYLKTGSFKPHPTLHTLTNAMDVGNPSNFPRILSIYDGIHKSISDDIKGYWFNDAQTCEGLVEIQKVYGYQADPHGAVAYLALKQFQEEHKYSGVFLETAHPGKFYNEVESATGKKVEMPIPLKNLFSLHKRSVRIPDDYNKLTDFLLA
jgi:threonine synthase